MLPLTRPGDGVRRGHVLVDSGVWIALIRANDQHHAQADTMLRGAIAARVPLITTNLILAEVQRFVLFHMGIKPALLILERVHASPALTIEYANKEHDASARAWLTRLADQTITYTDAVSFAVMQARRCTAAMSFDHDFVVAGFQLWQPA